jgi:hypothetical protein
MRWSCLVLPFIAVLTTAAPRSAQGMAVCKEHRARKGSCSERIGYLYRSRTEPRLRLVDAGDLKSAARYALCEDASCAQPQTRLPDAVQSWMGNVTAGHVLRASLMVCYFRGKDSLAPTTKHRLPVCVDSGRDFHIIAVESAPGLPP